MVALRPRSLSATRVSLAGGRIGEAQDNWGVHAQHGGHDQVSMVAKSLGFTGRQAPYTVLDLSSNMLNGKHLGPVGAVSSIAFNGLSRGAAVSDLIDEIAISEQAMDYLIHRNGGITKGQEGAYGDVRAAIMANNLSMAQRLTAGEDFEGNAGSTLSDVGTGLVASAIVPGGAVVKMGAQLAGGMAGNAIHDQIAPDKTLEFDQIQLYLMLKNYQDSGGVIDDTINQAALAFRGSETVKSMVKDRLGDRQALEALGEYLEARMAAQESGDMESLKHTDLYQAVNDWQVDDEMCREFCMTPPPPREVDENGEVEKRPTLGQLFARYGKKVMLDQQTGHYVSEMHEGARSMGTNFAYLILGDMQVETAEVLAAYQEDVMRRQESAMQHDVPHGGQQPVNRMQRYMRVDNVQGMDNVTAPTSVPLPANPRGFNPSMN